MAKQKFILAGFSTLLLVIIACNFTPPQSIPTSAPTQPVIISTIELPQQGQNNIPQTEADVPRVYVNDAKAAFDSGKAVIVDVRGTDAFAKGHIAGALFIPLGDIENDPANIKLDKNQWIITYCT